MSDIAIGRLVEETPFRRIARHFRRDRLAMAGLAGLVAVITIAVLAPWISVQNPYDLTQIDFAEGMLPPGSRSRAGFVYLLGSDDQGRDLLSAIFYGLRISVGVGIGSSLLAGAIGCSLGLIAAFRGGRIETLIMRLVDLQLAFPSILIALMILVFLGKGIHSVVIALVIVEWARYARAARAAAVVGREREDIEAAECLVLPRWRLIFRHLLPNCMPPLIVVAAIQIARAITLEATLSFLGLGASITEPSLGMLVANGYPFLTSGQYWVSFFPGLALLFIMVAINLVADRLRDLLNPRIAK